jgi:hypothetical protein
MPIKAGCALVKPPIDFTVPADYNRAMFRQTCVVDNANDNTDDEA